MAGWAWTAVTYAAIAVVMAVAGRATRRVRAIGGAIALAVISAGGARVDSVAAQVILPGGVALAGYWLSGLFVGVPQPWLEAWLLASDRHLFERLSLDRLLAAAPRWLLELLELSY